MIRPLTKEKVLCAVALSVGLLMLSSLHMPRSERVPDVPPEESARPYRVIAGAPQLSPERTFEGGRDPFQIQDAWSEAAPALLEAPPLVSYPRALPGGPTLSASTPRAGQPALPQRRRLMSGDPPAPPPAPPGGNQGGKQ